MQEHHLNETTQQLQGPTKEQIIVCNQWAATALDLFHANQPTEIILQIDGNDTKINLKWDSNFSKDAMRERKKIAEEGGVSLAWFLMSVILDYKYLQQTEIGEGVDYRFQKQRPTHDNFLQNSHYVEISALMKENNRNTLQKRIRDKHAQIDRGTHSEEPSSVIITLFEKPVTVKEIHR